MLTSSIYLRGTPKDCRLKNFAKRQANVPLPITRIDDATSKSTKNTKKVETREGCYKVFVEYSKVLLNRLTRQHQSDNLRTNVWVVNRIMQHDFKSIMFE